ncbi:MAG: DUF1883 domain-containing protein [Deltaproteobacteria bacterium]
MKFIHQDLGQRKIGEIVEIILSCNTVSVRLMDSSKHNRLMKAMDRINGQWGRVTVRSGASGYERQWGMKRARISNRFTTKWEELMTVKD